MFSFNILEFSQTLVVKDLYVGMGFGTAACR